MININFVSFWLIAWQYSEVRNLLHNQIMLVDTNEILA